MVIDSNVSYHITLPEIPSEYSIKSVGPKLESEGSLALIKWSLSRGPLV